MQVQYNRAADKIVVRGQHKGGNPRRWRIELKFDYSDCQRKVIFTPTAPCLATDLSPIITARIHLEKEVYPEAKLIEWIAFAR